MRKLRILTRRPLITVAVAFVTLFGSVAGYFAWEFTHLNRFEESISASPDPVLSEPTALPVPPGVTRILVFSTGSEGLDAEADGKRLGIGRARARMADGLTDSILLVTLHPDAGRVGIVSLPRDTWLDWRGHRINESFKRYGLDALVDDVETLTGLRAEHAVAMNFAAFADLTDSLGGVRMLFDAPARDAKAHLDIPVAGCINLDGATALSFVRSRHWQVYTDGRWHSDATSSDWGRILRQQAFVRAAASQLLTWQLPSRVPALFNVVQDNVTFDQGLSITKIAGLLQGFAANPPQIESMTFPGRGGVTESGASVIFPDLEGGLRAVNEFDALTTGITVPADGDLSATTPTPVPSSTESPLSVSTTGSAATRVPTSSQENSEPNPAGTPTQKTSPNRWPSC